MGRTSWCSGILSAVVSSCFLAGLLGTAGFVRGLSITGDPAGIVNRTYDFVVVGGGTAGLTVASRLAEVEDLAILVIEAGSDEQNNTDVNDPQRWSTLLGSRLDWNYTTVPQLIGGIAKTVDAGKVLGGSSSINGQEYARGTKDQYDALEKLGNPGWNWDSMLKYMQKSESFHPPSAEQKQQGATFDPSVHGYRGPLSVAYPVPYVGSKAIQAYLSSAEGTIQGLEPSMDVSDGQPNGGNALYFTIEPGKEGTVGGNRRCSAAVGYVYPALGAGAGEGGKEGLTILTEHFGTGIVWSAQERGKPVRAVGVRFVSTPAENATIGVEMSVGVRREVIVASGALATPHFLELSGIGNKTILERASVPVVVDLPSVGTNYQDGASVIQQYNLAPGVPPVDVQTINAPGTGASALVNVTQVLGEVGGRKAASKLRASVQRRAREIVQSGGFTSLEGMTKMLAYQAESIADLDAPVIEMTFFPDAPGNLSGVVQFGLLPQTRGTVHITSSNPSVRSSVDPRFLQVQFDRELLGNSTKIMRKVFSSAPLNEFYDAELVPGLQSVPENATDEEWQAFVVGNYNVVLKGVGSVSMLPREEGGAVDSELMVYGTANVRAVDASVMPIQISAAHLSATVYGIAEKAADIIRMSLSK